MSRPSLLPSGSVIEAAKIKETNDEPVCLQMLRARHHSPVVFYTAIFLLLTHLIVMAVMPLFVSDETYLYLYLGNDARESTKRFLDGKHPFLVYDPLVGWRNRPDLRRDKWKTDEHGARTTHRVSTASSRKRVVMFLGNSLINGSINVSNEETISAYIEDASTESINFATMLYTLDQIYLDYKGRLAEYKADVVVVGLPSDPTAGLLNQYIPFRVKVESKMPFFKPRFELSLNELSVVPVPPLTTYGSLFNNSDALKTLAKTDAYYKEFRRYKRFGLMPVSNGIHSIYKKIRDDVRPSGGNAGGMPLLKKLIAQMVSEARTRNAAIVFVTLPDLKAVAPGVLEQYLPDRYAGMVKALEGEGYPLLDVRPLLRKSGLPPEKLFDPDGSHYSSTGNRIIAAALKNVIAHLNE